MIQVPLTHGKFAVVDNPDADVLAWHWRAINPSPGIWYAARDLRRNGVHTCLTMHVHLTGWKLTDHKDRDGLNNRRSNLREANRSLNGANTRKRRGSRNSLRGAIWRPGDKWEARIRGRVLGRFLTEEAAGRAYDAAAVIEFGEFARLNFPEEQ